MPLFMFAFILVVAALFISSFINSYLVFSLILKTQTKEFKLGIAAALSVLLTIISIKYCPPEFPFSIMIIYGAVTGFSFGILQDIKRYKKTGNAGFDKTAYSKKENSRNLRRIAASALHILLWMSAGIMIIFFLIKFLDFSVAKALPF